MRNYFGFALIFALSSVIAAPETYSIAKRYARVLFHENPVTLYCACHYDKNRIDLKSCGMESAKHIKRARRVEFEHMMPAENFGRHLVCWREKICRNKEGKAYKGRSCCRKKSPEFNEAEAELYNLWPSVGLVNQARSNFRFSPLPRRSGFYGCDIEIDKKQRKVDPPNRAKGIVARANLFMSERYNIRLSPAQRKLFKAWSKQYPPTEQEKSWAASVAKVEGYQNRYIHK